MNTDNESFTINENISILEANKKESFDGMRAYHQSELSHLQHTLQIMWRSMLSVAIIPNGALFLQGPVTVKTVVASAIILIISGIIVHRLFKGAETKIKDDNKTYNRYGKEYIKTCDLLHLSSPIKINNQYATLKDWSKGKPGDGKGYEKTIKIIKSSAWTFFYIPLAYFVIFLTLLFSL